MAVTEAVVDPRNGANILFASHRQAIHSGTPSADLSWAYEVNTLCKWWTTLIHNRYEISSPIRVFLLPIPGPIIYLFHFSENSPHKSSRRCSEFKLGTRGLPVSALEVWQETEFIQNFMQYIGAVFHCGPNFSLLVYQNERKVLSCWVWCIGYWG